MDKNKKVAIILYSVAAIIFVTFLVLYILSFSTNNDWGFYFGGQEYYVLGIMASLLCAGIATKFILKKK